jgi:acylpyruvate hydrolase
MRLATLRTAGGTAAVRVAEDVGVETGHADVGELLRAADWRQLAEQASGPRHQLDQADYAPLIPAPGKILCVGLNYREHILEMGRDLPEFPALFAKFAPALVGAYDEVVLPSASAAMDWEAELAVVVGRPARHVGGDAAQAAIAGYSILNDVTARDWQYRTAQWLQGKTFEASTPLGPFLVTPDDAAIAGRQGLDLACEVDGQHKQAASTDDLVFDPAALVSYISSILTLLPGDVIATGTPGGVGHARNPRQYLTEGSVLVTRIEGLGHCRNTCRAEKR